MVPDEKKEYVIKKELVDITSSFYFDYCMSIASLGHTLWQVPHSIQSS